MTRERPVNVACRIRSRLPRFLGTVSQRPPRHAALKYQGRNYYEYAREGVEIPRTSREIVISELAIQGWSSPLVELSVRCGKGTYIRVLAEDLGEVLGCGAHVTVLRRTATGGFRIAEAVNLNHWPRSRTPIATVCYCRPMRPALRCPGATLTARRPGFREGRAVPRAELPDATYRTYAGGVFAGVADASQGLLRPRRLVAASAGRPLVEWLESQALFELEFHPFRWSNIECPVTVQEKAKVIVFPRISARRATQVRPRFRSRR